MSAGLFCRWTISLDDDDDYDDDDDEFQSIETVIEKYLDNYELDCWNKCSPNFQS